MQDGCKVYMDSYMASCVLISWINFKSHLLEVGLTQNRETVALQNLTTVDLLYLIMCEDPAWIEIHWNSSWLRARSHMTSHTTLECMWPHYMTWKCLGTTFKRFLLGSHRFVVTTLGSCVKWPLYLLFHRLLETCPCVLNYLAIIDIMSLSEITLFMVFGVTCVIMSIKPFWDVC